MLAMLCVLAVLCMLAIISCPWELSLQKCALGDVLALSVRLIGPLETGLLVNGMLIGLLQSALFMPSILIGLCSIALLLPALLIGLLGIAFTLTAREEALSSIGTTSCRVHGSIRSCQGTARVDSAMSNYGQQAVATEDEDCQDFRQG